MKKIEESPDWVEVPIPNTGNVKRLTSWSEGYSFGYYKQKLYISGQGKTHGYLADTIGMEYAGKEPRYIFKYAGRIWPDKKLISFWTYPETDTKMKKIADDIDKEFDRMYSKKLHVWNDFQMDIIVNKKDNSKIYKKFPTPTGEIRKGQEIKIIPVRMYQSSLQRSPEELQIPHVMTPMDKFRKGIKIYAPGFGAEKRYILPSKYADKIGKGYNIKDIPAFIHHQIQRTSDGIIKLKSLVENTIAKVSKDINVKIDIDKTVHAGQRQFRHETPISDEEIIRIVSLALPEIANQLMFDEINMGSYVLIKNDDNLNIIGVLHPGNNGVIDFVVITVMKKKDFMPKKNTKIIEV